MRKSHPFFALSGMMTAALLIPSSASANQWLVWYSNAHGSEYVRYVRKFGPRVVEVKRSFRGNYTPQGVRLEDAEVPLTVDCKRSTLTGLYSLGGAAFQHWDITPEGSWSTHSHYPDREQIRTKGPMNWKLLSFVCNQWGGGLN